LNALSGRSAIADVVRRGTGQRLARPSDLRGKPSLDQSGCNSITPSEIEAADPYGLAVAIIGTAKHTENRLRGRDQPERLRFVEPVRSNVQFPVVPTGPQSFKQIKGEFSPAMATAISDVCGSISPPCGTTTAIAEGRAVARMR
jgi:hypothetical protein